MYQNKGFTLIELLVVVLIIGILAAVALPQYEKAVMKTRTLSFLPMLRAIDEAEQIYYLANGTYTFSFDDLDISLPSGATVTHEDKIETFTYHNWECLLWGGPEGSTNLHSAYCYSTLPGVPKLEKYFSKDYFVCWGGEEGSKGYELCKAISNKSVSDQTSARRGPGFSFK